MGLLICLPDESKVSVTIWLFTVFFILMLAFPVSQETDFDCLSIDANAMKERLFQIRVYYVTGVDYPVVRICNCCRRLRYVQNRLILIY